MMASAFSVICQEHVFDLITKLQMWFGKVLDFFQWMYFVTLFPTVQCAVR